MTQIYSSKAQPDQGGTPRRFALIGAAGFVAPKHMKAVKDTGNVLVAALDPNDSVGVIDSYFPDADFFTEFERFDRHVDKLRRKNKKVDFISVCSPNYLHDAHIRFALRSEAHAICEKPLVLNPWNVDALAEIEAETGLRIYNILQLRLHPSIIALRDSISRAGNATHDVDIAYITSRGRWYHSSWKGELSKSGGIATNIGVHFFDMLSWVFGAVESSTVHLNRADCAAGRLLLKNARIRWFLSINAEHLPEAKRRQGQRTYRSITLGGSEIEFSEGFTDLHTESYRHILSGGGFGLEEACSAVQTIHRIRGAQESPLTGDFHPFCQLVRN
jgi:UDP-N-acetyl-2-amino-2-deoxyglucuronate dehydrogenase